MKICQDMDGCIFDLNSEFCRIFNEIHGTNRTPEEMTSWEYYQEWGMTKAECFAIYNGIDQKNTKLLDKRIPEYLKELNEKHQLDIVTLKPFYKYKMVKKALEMNGIIEGIHYRKLIVKTYTVGHVKITLDYDVYIDDSEKLAKHMQTIDTEKILLLYESPWNQSISSGKSIIKVSGWEEIMKRIEEIENE